MRILVNALSATHLSGHYVLYGHVRQLATWSQGEHEFLVLAPPRDLANRPELPDNVTFVEAPRVACRSGLRSAWETCILPSMLRRLGAQLYFTPAGTVLPRSPVPQVSLAQNPWCLTDAVPKSSSQWIKAAFQRSAYRRAQRTAALMVYNSNYMRELYCAAAGPRSKPSLVAYQALDDATHQAACEAIGQIERRPDTVLAVSVMAKWKGADTLVMAIGQLNARGLPVRLRLVGPWPDRAYEQRVRQLVAGTGLQNQVTITGLVDNESLYREFASARVFALPSRCESFGIPALQAQAFGTPVVGSNTTAMAEVGGDGGLYGPPDDPVSVADQIEQLLSDKVKWSIVSAAARANVERFRWESCSLPLTQMFTLAP